jgi:ADP-heptose:LPS heptosyltransferase
VHLAAAVGCPVSAIFNGSQFGRFAPYPEELQHKIQAVYPTEIKSALAQPEIVQKKYLYTVDIPYELVLPSQVIKTINPLTNE